ncbi:MAG TPA: TIM44-like domain-containing protein [Devosia sp.]|nr:TIM44-like domain-containing protein [Devosia sp.]
MFASRGFRLSAVLASLVMVFSLMAVDTAEARRFGSFGSRGMFTSQSIPRTPTSPAITSPVQKSMTGATTASTMGTTAAYRARPSFWGGFGGGLLGGFLFSGLFGMMFGYGFGGFGGVLALLIQVFVLFLILRALFGRRTVTAGGPSPYMGGPSPRDWQPSGGGTHNSAPRSRASDRAGSRDRLGLTDRDLGVFEERLAGLQDAYAREDYDALRQITTPEVMGYLAEELGTNASKGLRNEVYDVRLINGDIAQAWREGNTEYATVAMLYESRDITRERATGKIVSGEDRPTQTTEIWTFVRTNGGKWLVSAIQEAGK